MRLLRLEAGLGKLGILVAEANDERLLVSGDFSLGSYSLPQIVE